MPKSGDAQVQPFKYCPLQRASGTGVGATCQCLPAQGRSVMKRRHLGPRPVSVLGCVLIGTSAVSFGATASLAATPPDPGKACADLAALTNFPVTPTQITLAKFNPAGAASSDGAALPDHCQVQGIVNKRTGTDGFPYGDRFEVRLPVQWNGRFMFQGGGGTEGAVPPATGNAGTLSPALAHGWAVASQDGGHENKDLPVPNQFFLDPQAVTDHAYRSIDATAQSAKFLIDAYYGQAPDRSYFVGCSTGGRQGMVFSQNFPDYFDGIVAGDPVYDLEAISLSEDWGVQAIAAITPTPIAKLANGGPVLYPAFPTADQNLFTSAILAACDKLDGTADGVVDNLPACWAKFDPATFVFPDTGQPLQCIGAKTATCLSAAQIDAVKKINQGPRNSLGQPIKVPASLAVREHPDNTVFGYAYDGGFMTPTGIPSRKIGTSSSPPGDFALGLGQIPYHWIAPANPRFDPLRFDFDKDVDNLNKSTPLVTYSASTDMARFKQRHGKIIWYHGVSDPGPPVHGTIAYYQALAARNGGVEQTKEFARLFLIPNMGHCRGGPATDQFDMLTPLVEWVEQGKAPDQIIASGMRFSSPPTTRSRPLCPYPQEARYVGPAGGDLGAASNYACVTPR
jgi:feruloyl esterase